MADREITDWVLYTQSNREVMSPVPRFRIHLNPYLKGERWIRLRFAPPHPPLALRRRPLWRGRLLASRIPDRASISVLLNPLGEAGRWSARTASSGGSRTASPAT